MKKIKISPLYIIAALVVIFAAVCVFLSAKGSAPLNLDQIKIAQKKITLNACDEMASSCQDGVTFLNDREYKGFATIYGNVSIGTKAEDVLSAFDVKEGFALINAEVASDENDGTTSVTDAEYTDGFFDKDNCNYLDAYIIIGYKKQNNEFIPMTNDELKDPAETCDSAVVFAIDINGLEDNIVSVGEVMGIYIKCY